MAATPTIVIGRNNWGVKNGNLLGYYQSDDNFFVKREFTVTRGGGTNGTFVGSNGFIQTAASGNIPRISYLGGSPRLLVEPAATNLALQSENFELVWTTTTVGPITGVTSPAGTNNASTFTSANLTDRVRQAITLSSGTTYNFSFFGKFGALSSGFSLMVIDENATSYGSGVCQSFNLIDGTIGSSGTVGSGFTLQGAKIENYGNNWYRCSMTVLMSYTPTTPRVGFRIGTQISSGRPQSVPGGSVTVWGAQLETGSVATSYIPTTTASVTRNTDSVTITGATDYIGQTEGTIYLETDALISGASDLFCFARATTNTVSISKNSSNIIQATVYTSGLALNIAASSTVSGNLKIAVAYKTGDSALYINGVQIGTSATAFAFTAALTQININPTVFFEGSGNQRISTLSIYNTRLSNTELATLTTT